MSAKTTKKPAVVADEPMRVVTFRLPEKIIEELDAVAKTRADRTGFEWNRNKVLRYLLRRALDEERKGEQLELPTTKVA